MDARDWERQYAEIEAETDHISDPVERLQERRRRKQLMLQEAAAGARVQRATDADEYGSGLVDEIDAIEAEAVRKEAAEELRRIK